MQKNILLGYILILYIEIRTDNGNVIELFIFFSVGKTRILIWFRWRSKPIYITEVTKKIVHKNNFFKPSNLYNQVIPVMTIVTTQHGITGREVGRKRFMLEDHHTIHKLLVSYILCFKYHTLVARDFSGYPQN